MKDEGVFIEVEGYQLPEPLSKKETLKLFKSSKFDEEARNKIIEHNIRIVLYRIKNRFNDYDYEKKELVSIGIFGLMKAVDTYDSSKGYEFNTYASKCVDNEILMFIRKSSKITNNISLDEEISSDIKLEDILESNDDFREKIEKRELFTYLRSLIDELNERDKKIIMLYFGFYNDKCYSSTEISKIIKLSRAYISRIIVKIVNNFGVRLEKEGFTELHFNCSDNNDKNVKKEVKIKSIYELFNKYTEEEIDTMILGLNDKDKKLLTIRYGNDLHQPHNIPLSEKDYKAFYGVLIKKMKRRLEKIAGKSNTIEKDSNDKSIHGLSSKQNTQLEEITKKDSIKLFDLFKIPSIYNIASILTIKEAIIISLKLGYVDGKCFSNNQIAASLGISEEEVRETIKKIVLLYKENIKQDLDSLPEASIQNENIRTLNINNKKD